MTPNAARNTKTVTDQLTLDALKTLWQRLDTLSDQDLVKLQVMLQELARAVDFEIDFRKRWSFRLTTIPDQTIVFTVKYFSVTNKWRIQLHRVQIGAKRLRGLAKIAAEQFGLFEALEVKKPTADAV